MSKAAMQAEPDNIGHVGPSAPSAKPFRLSRSPDRPASGGIAAASICQDGRKPSAAPLQAAHHLPLRQAQGRQSAPKVFAVTNCFRKQRA